MSERWDDVLVTALTDRGWWVLEQRALYARSPNPTLLSVRRGRLAARLLVYGWRVTDEGKGRKKKGRLDRDYRIQTTVPGRRPIHFVEGYVPVGLGWDEERSVFASFDVWVKRYANWSDSVHFTRALLDSAAAHGWAVENRSDGPEAAFTPDRVDDLFRWLSRLGDRRTIGLSPESYNIADDTLTLSVANPKQKHSKATWARPDDYVILRNESGDLIDRYVWRIADEPEAEWDDGDSEKRRLYRLIFRAVRHGIIRDRTWREAL